MVGVTRRLPTANIYRSAPDKPACRSSGGKCELDFAYAKACSNSASRQRKKEKERTSRSFLIGVTRRLPTANIYRPAPDKPACRSSGGKCELDFACAKACSNSASRQRKKEKERTSRSFSFFGRNVHRKFDRILRSRNDSIFTIS